ncbi:MAG: 16S rRNA (cytosine(1402)-N(4))-methyltransferase RsmH [bacterium]|nr:16S rRNA (cytosine(1402)-N(4))-methyltransferase RsmH [bacterium]
MPHIPVLLKETVEGLNIKSGSVVLDATFGGGGHSREICKIVGNSGKLLSLDADPVAKTRIDSEAMSSCNFELVTANFRDIDKVMEERKIEKLDGAMFDLGLSSFQLDDGGRGFTFQKDEPLQMTFGAGAKFTAEEIVNGWDEENIADIIYGYGGEQFSRRIAKKIVEERKIGPIKTTFQLVRIIGDAVPDFYRKRKIHFATKTFQALRITVNDEIGALKEAIEKAWLVLNSGGRLAVISFHELEDRVVKIFFRDKKAGGMANAITKKPIVPSKEETSSNPRSRSAKLRVVEKI